MIQQCTALHKTRLEGSMLGHNGREQGRGETALEREGRYTGLTQETGRPVIKAIPLNHVLNYVLMYSTNKWDLRN